MPDVMVAYIHPRGDVGVNFHKSLTNMLFYDANRPPDARRVALCASQPAGTGSIPLARNSVMADFLAKDVDWLLAIDADMGFAPDLLDKLLSVADPDDRPLVGGLCFAQRSVDDDGLNGYSWEPKPTIFDYADMGDGKGRRLMYRHWYPVNSVIRCDSTGGACVLMHRNVATRVFDEAGAEWFTPLSDAQGVMSEDHSFFTRCHQLGIPLHVHTGAKTNHAKNVWMDEALFWRHADPPPANERVDVIVPVLHRPQNVRPLMESLTASTGLATAWFVCDRGDRVEQEEVLAYGGRILKRDGSFAQKVNYAFGKIERPAPWILLVGDDVQFRPGWLDHALFTAWNTPGTNVVGTNDLGNKRVTSGEHATHMLIRRSYIDEVGATFFAGPGVVCNEEYRHWFVDDEIVTAARMRGGFQAALGSVIEHMHPYWDKAAPDEVYSTGEFFAERDRVVFQFRLKRALAEQAVAA